MFLHCSNSIVSKPKHVIIMDFAKAFVKVPHRWLLYTLEYYDITAQSLHWISAFLSNRTQTVVIDRKSSSTIPVTSGVPQAQSWVQSCFWPILMIYQITWPTASSDCTGDRIIYKPVRSLSDWNTPGWSWCSSNMGKRLVDGLPSWQVHSLTSYTT